MNPATSATATPTARRVAYGVFSQFWTLVNASDVDTRLSGLELIDPAAKIKITRIGQLQNPMAVGYAKRWSRQFGQLGNPHLSHQLALVESDDKKSATILLECVYRLRRDKIISVRHSEQEPDDQKFIMVHRVRLGEDGRIIAWTVMIEDESLLARIA